MAIGAVLSVAGHSINWLGLHLRSVGWAPGQVLDPWAGYWQLFYRLLISEERVMAARRSAVAAWHPALQIGAFALAGAGYVLILHAIRALPQRDQPRLRRLVLLALLFSVPLLLLPNLLSGDVYSNISFGRVGAIHGQNPFIDPPEAFPRDPYTGWVDWKEVPSVYGPGWIYPSMLLTLAIEALWSHILVYVLAYKLFALLLHLLNALLIAMILARWRPDQRIWGTALYLLNPLALLEFAGNAHNDVLMITYILLGVLLHLHGRWRWAVVMLTLAVLTKWIALPLLPLYGLVHLWSIGAWPGRLRRLATIGLLSALLCIGLYLPYWEGPSTLAVLIEAPPQQRFKNSLGELLVDEVGLAMYRLGYWPHPGYESLQPLVLRTLRDSEVEPGQRGWRDRQRVSLQRYNQQERALRAELLVRERHLQNAIRLVGLGIVAFACLVGAAITRNLDTMLRAGAWIFFVYVTVGAVWVWPWYATWFVALAALLDWRVTGRVAVLLSVLAPLPYPLFSNLPSPGLPERFRALLIFGPPLALAGFYLLRAARSRMRRLQWSRGLLRAARPSTQP